MKTAVIYASRDAFQQMMKDSDKKAWDYVLVYKLDRFSRNKFEMAMHRKHLKDNGIKILSAMENIPDSPEGILLESLLEGYEHSNGHNKKIKYGLKRFTFGDKSKAEFVQTDSVFLLGS